MKDKLKEKLLKEFRHGDGIAKTVVDYLLEKAIEETKKEEQKRFMRLVDECADKTDIWDSERWDNFRKLLKKEIKND